MAVLLAAAWIASAVAAAVPEQDAAGDGRDDAGRDDPSESWDERVAVTADLRESTSAPLGASSTVHDIDRDTGSPSTLTDVVVGAPGVSENGQGGHFQVFSIRGVSRHRVLNLVSGIRINSERRAGASVSFVDPLLLGTVEVIRGPATTLQGSGALGGVVQVTPRSFDGPTFQLGYDSAGDERYQVLGFGARDWSLGFSRREAEDADAADGTRLNSRFTQYSAVLSKTWDRGPLTYSALFIPTLAEDIGKANDQFPDQRRTSYPLERHQLLKLAVSSERGWQLDGYVHAHDLQTHVVDLEDDTVSTVTNDSFDYGARFERTLPIGDGAALRWGLQSAGRAGVSAIEERTGTDPGDPGRSLALESLGDARELETGAFATVQWNRAATDYEVGARVSRQTQANSGAASESQGALNGYAGVTRRVGKDLRIRAGLSSGLRFANLSERFFSGTTGAGEVVGNPDLDPERALNAETSIRWLGRKVFVDASLFRTEIDDYIERLEVSDGSFTFRNLISGTLEGVELQTVVFPAAAWKVTAGGSSIRGRDEKDFPLADVPADRVHAGVSWERGPWRLATRLTHRLPKTDPGSGEERIPGADVWSGGLTYRFADVWEIAVTGTNLLDETYFPAADRRAVPVPGRAFGIRLSRRGRS